MQIRPDTGADVARRHGIPWRGPKTLFDAATNVRLGTIYLEELIERFDSVPVALAAYNWGPTRIARAMRAGRPVPQGYAKRVLAGFERFTGAEGEELLALAFVQR